MKTVTRLADIPSEYYAVVSLDPQTGTPLNENRSWCTEGDGFFWIFESEDSAVNYCRLQLAESPSSEWIIVNHSGAQINRFANDDLIVESQSTKPKRKSWFSRLTK